MNDVFGRATKGIRSIHNLGLALLAPVLRFLPGIDGERLIELAYRPGSTPRHTNSAKWQNDYWRDREIPGFQPDFIAPVKPGSAADVPLPARLLSELQCADVGTCLNCEGGLFAAEGRPRRFLR